MRLRTPVLVAIIGLLLGGIIVLNRTASRFAPGGPDEPRETAPSTATPAARQESEKQTGSNATTAGADALVQLPVDSTKGPTPAQRQVTFGWVWTPEVQADPAKVYQAIEAARAVVPDDVALRIVNVDAVPGAPRGIWVDGKPLRELPTSGALDPAQVKEDIQHVLGIEHHH